tara:strand:+ start:1610 stop:2209 length:600 start_codon:yes stop_codon:yes gene_type:complete
VVGRKKKIRLVQLSLLLLGILIIFFTYKENKSSLEDKIITEAQEKIKDKIDNQTEGDIFFNIEYSGLDLSGNRYVLKSEEAFTDKVNKDIINMKLVTAIFYFKDGTVLNVYSKTGVYNNKTLDMNFYGNVKADYIESKLYAEKAEYSNTKSFLTISENVVVKDEKGTMIADKLIFDIKKQTLNIAAFKNNKINANINLK